MKTVKYFFLLIVALLLSSCACVLSQIPPQFVVAGTGCQAALPDYTPLVVATDNCGIQSKVQTPAPGFILTEVNHPITVTIRVTDVSGNFVETSTTSTLVDNVPPVITYDTTAIIAENWRRINLLYDVADRLVAEQERFFDTTFDWEAAGIPEDMRPIGQYDKKALLTWSYDLNDKRERLFTFVSKNDLFTIK